MAKIAYIVGRFQNIDLHNGYIHLFKEALKITDVEEIVLIIGSSSLPSTKRNPFTFTDRIYAINDFLCANHPQLAARITDFIEQNDQNEDPYWSQTLDEKIFKHINKVKDERVKTYDPVLVCSRDSFKDHYSGVVSVIEVEPNLDSISSTTARENLAKAKVYPNRSYLMGKLNAIYSKYPTVYPTVDVAIIKEETGEILLGRKHRETKWRFPGGFTDPTDDNFEAAAKREAFEEVGPIELGNWKYICSHKVDDWRYRNEIDKIITTFFRCSYIFGIPKASDDLAEVKWFKLSEIKQDDVFPGHWTLLQKLNEYESKD